MTRQLSQSTINEYLPIIRSIQADLDARLQSPSFENSPIFRIAENTLGHKFGFQALAQVLSIVRGWIGETGITTGKGQDSYCFVKTNDAGLWSRMYELIEENISAYQKNEAPTSSSKTKEKIGTIVNLPKGTEWKDLEFRFKNTHAIDVFYRGELVGTEDYERLGFGTGNTRDKNPNKSWEFLRLLAITTGYEAKKAPMKSLFIDPLKTTEVGCDQIKGRLSEKLKPAFGIWDDPFHPYDRDKGYQTKFALKPERGLRGDGELHASGGTLYGEKLHSNVLEGMED